MDIRPAPAAARGFVPLLIGMAMTIVDVPMMAIAMPGIGVDLALGTGPLTLIAGAYPLVVAMLLLPAGRAGDRFGRRRVFHAGGALFLIGALLSALAPGPLLLAGARMLQGVGAAAVAPQALAMIPQLFAPVAQSGAFARLAMTGSFASVCGPLLAGALLVAAPDWLGWRAIFLAEAAVALTVILMARWQPSPEEPSKGGGSRPVETASFAALILCLVAPLSLGPAFGWPASVFLMLAAAMPCAALFVLLTAQGGPAALIPPALLREPGFRWSLVFLLLAVSAPPGFFMVLSLALQSDLGLSPLQTGLVTAGFPAGVVAGSWMAGRLALKPLARVALGIALLCGSFLLIHAILPGMTPGRLWPLRAGMLMAGAAMGMTVTSVMQLGMSGLPKSLAGAGAGAIQTMQQVAMAASIALSFAVYGQALETRPGLEAASTMMWLQITTTGAAALLALALLRLRNFHHRKTEA
ncbi:MFS transporter [Cereibacter johrii]|uniref:MFS transporter n=1 Tax=Cereibacter johrii TaxID=445629 RepID=UPI002B25C1F1|nr:MFS transporter [Cereibacter johrii]MEA5162481.1 MFS transporter [Cereibacter johrii]